MTLSAGIILGRYKVQSKLGAGGMGEVYLVHDMRLNRRVALKVLPDDLVGNPQRIHRFKQEAQAASALNHPNIITIHEIGVEGSTHFIATEFIDGESLRQRMKGGDLTLSEALEISVQVASALAAAHETGIIHRDIKPENIMLRRDGYVKVLDFGLAKLTEKSPAHQSPDFEASTLLQTDPGTVMGTTQYLSPEQARGLEVDARSDIFSLGVVLYEMVTSRLPFQGQTASDLIAAILKSDPALPSSFNREMPAELERIILKALAKASVERYQTTLDFLNDLKAFKQDLEFRNKLGQSTTQNLEEAKTQKFSAMTADATHAIRNANHPLRGIKNHKRSLAVILSVLVLAVAGFSYWWYVNRTANTKQIESIAVLPFQNESGNADNEYLSDGMTESLIGSLSQIPELSVKARSSVFRYKGKETDVRKIARELNVQAILTGRVLQRGDQLILNLEVVDGETENVIWKEQYSRKQTDLVSLQSEIARDVSSRLRAKLTGAEQNQIAKNYTQNSEAYQLYLKGRFFQNSGTREGQQKSIEYFRQAVNLDPNFALGYAGIADAYTVLGTTHDASLSPREAMPSAKAAAQKALDIDPSLSEAHTSMAWIKYRFDWDWRGAEDEFKQAIALNANNAQAHHWYADYLMAMKRFDEALAEIRRARELDPFSLIINWNVGRILYFARRYDESLAELRQTLEMDQNSPRTYAYLEFVYTMKGLKDEAFEAHLKSVALAGESAERLAALKTAYAQSGFKAAWEKELEFALEDAKSRYITPFNLARLYVNVGDKNRALDLLNQAYDMREGSLVYINTDPYLDDLRADARFQDLLRRIGLMP